MPLSGMLFNLIVIFYIVLLDTRKSSSYFIGDDSLAYCPGEAFQAKCRKNEFITMKAATYGRMKLGRCIKNDEFGYMGCKTDVLEVADRNCSGKQSCTIRVSNIVMDKMVSHTCNLDLTRYLEADYRCETALYMDKPCQKPTTVPVQSGHITSQVVQNTGCGNKTAPWLLTAQPGQTLNLSLLDFHWNPDGRELDTRIAEDCPMRYGYIIDTANNQLMQPICGGGRRYKRLYHSVSNVLQVVLEHNWAEKASFAVKFEAIGCPDLIQPKDALLRREGNKTMVECHSRKQEWHLTCVGTKWVGVIGNCTQQAAAIARQSQMQDGGFGIPHGVAIFIVIAISLIISGIIIFIGTMCIHSYSHTKTPQRGMERIYNQQQYQQHQQLQKDNTRCANPNLHRNEYMHIWDHPLPEPCIEEYQLPLQNNNITTENEQDVLSKMKVIHDEMSRGLEKCVNTGNVMSHDDHHIVGIESPRMCMPGSAHNNRLLTLEVDNSHTRGSM